MNDTWKDIERNKVWRKMRMAEQAVDEVLTGKWPMKMICSDPGMGKTEMVQRKLKKHGLNYHPCSPSTVAGFCHDMWNHKNEAFFLDDCDALARSEPCMNIAKKAWGEQHLVVCPSTKEILKNEERKLADDDKYDPRIPDPVFKLGNKFSLIWCSNKNFENVDGVLGNNLVGDFRALISRGLDPLWIPNDPQSKFDYVLYKVAAERLLRGHAIGRHDGGFSLAHQNDVIKFFCEHARYMKEISIRSVLKLAKIRRDQSAYYEDSWQEQLSSTLQWPALVLPSAVPMIYPPVTKASQAE